ncbi:MAG: hypothetical protein KAX42_03095, partial [Sphaerotilus sp.]|nr:hypothetical protein [Sphaerotilus sp.]
AGTGFVDGSGAGWVRAGWAIPTRLVVGKGRGKGKGTDNGAADGMGGAGSAVTLYGTDCTVAVAAASAGRLQASSAHKCAPSTATTASAMPGTERAPDRLCGSTVAAV